ncbi:MAG: DUF935 family protein [Acetobacter aceti]
MTLIDPKSGKAFPPSMLARPVGGATVVGSRPAFWTTPLGAIDPATLASMLAEADQGNSLQWHNFAEQIETRDLHYLGVLSTRKRSVSQLPIVVTPAGPSAAQKKQADLVQGWLDRQVLRRSLFDFLDAIGKGFSVHAIQWGLKPGAYMPDRFLFRPQRWFDISWQDGESVKIRDDASAGFTPDMDGATVEGGFSALDPRTVVIHKHPSWSGLTLQSGLTRAICWASMFKFFTVRDWGVFIQNYGIPGRLGRFGQGSSERDRDVLWRALTDYGGMLAAMIPKEMDFELIEAKGGTGAAEVHENRVKWLDEQISKAVLGQTGTTDARTGTHAAGAIHRLVQEDIERHDALLLSVTINEQVVRPMIDMSFGGPAEDYPLVLIGRPDEVPVSELVSLLQWAGPQGLKVRADDIYARTGLEKPEEGDDTIGVTAQPVPVQPSHALPGEQRPAQTLPGRATPPSVQSDVEPGQEAEADQGAGKSAPVVPPVSTHVGLNLGEILERHAQRVGKSAILDMLGQRVGGEIEQALSAMSAPIRKAVQTSDSFEELETTIRKMKLPTDQMTAALEQANALAFMLGDAAALEAMGDDNG